MLSVPCVRGVTKLLSVHLPGLNCEIPLRGTNGTLTFFELDQEVVGAFFTGDVLRKILCIADQETRKLKSIC